MYTSVTARLLLNGHQQPALPRKQQVAAGTCREGWVMARGSVVAAAAARPGRRARRITAAAAAAPGSDSFPSASTVLASSGNRRYSATEIFVCDEESAFYAQSLEKLLPQAHAAGRPNGCVVEFGSGDGAPVVAALQALGDRFPGTVHGFELNPTSASLAQQHAAAAGLRVKYEVKDGCFYAGTTALGLDRKCSTIVANPPYLPAPNNRLMMPALWGGVDGAELTRDLLTLGYDSAVLLISSYSNPLSVLRHARAHGYRVADYLLTPLTFGTYSSEPKVRTWIGSMRDNGEAFYAGSTYLLAGVLFRKDPQLQAAADHAAGLSSNGNGNGHSNGNGNGHSTANGGGQAHAAEEAGQADLSDSLAMVLTSLQ